jgi:NADH:ubiquinone oxidoreductase subunit D
LCLATFLSQQVSKEEAINLGFTGPCLRATGVPYDVRRARPYYHYDEFDFEIPVGTVGDTYDRLILRLEEMRQSEKIIEQALEKLPPGPILLDDPRIALPPKAQVYGSIEGLMNHFMLLTDGIKPPRGEIYSATEAANGELGFYILSDGGPRPYRLRCRAPCFPLTAAYSQLVEGGMIADAVAILGSLNIVVGELDR